MINALQPHVGYDTAALSGEAAVLYAELMLDTYGLTLLNHDVPIQFQPLHMDAFGAWKPGALNSVNSSGEYSRIPLITIIEHVHIIQERYAESC